ncbi:MAG: hypothetical protein GEV08_11860 [Acidimicrobiia bacterium]|nr:hypothetical protein [Acidimicrobiia bacterium]
MAEALRDGNVENIDVERPDRNERAPEHDGDIRIHYQSHSPIIARADGQVSLNCDLSHEEWGDGAARGVVVDGDIRHV